MNKLIIDNRTNLSDLDATLLVKQVIAHGRISNDEKQYCYMTTIEHQGNDYNIYTDLNKRSDRFVIMPDRHPKKQ